MFILNPLHLQIKKMFDKADKDGDGKLTKEEWYNVLNSSGCDTSMQVRQATEQSKTDYLLGRKSRNSLIAWIVIMMVALLTGSSWGRRQLWRRSSRTWTKMEMVLSPRRSVECCSNRFQNDFHSTFSKEFTKLCKHLTPEQVEEGFAKFDTSGDNK